MTVKEVFELRKEGRIEEAYNAILPMYKVHHGHYTTLCMFWCAADMARLHISHGNTNEAEKILQSLIRLYPSIEDKDLSAKRTLLIIALSLKKANNFFSLYHFMQWWGIDNLTDDDYKSVQSASHPLPSTGQRIATHLFREVREQNDEKQLTTTLTYIEKTLSHIPRNRHLLRAKALLLCRLGQTKEAEKIYRQLAQYGKEAYLFSELSELTADDAEKIALTVKAIQLQRTEAFRQKDRLRLAQMLQHKRPPFARYEVDMCVKTRQIAKQHNNRRINALLRQLQDVTPATTNEQQAFYQKALAYLQKSNPTQTWKK